MSILITVVLTLVFCLTPALVLWLCRRFPLLGKVGPIMVLYAIGMIIGNLPVLPAEIKSLQDMIPNIMVPLAIPMMLFGCTFSRKELRLQVKLCASGFLSVCIAVVVGYLLFGRHVEQGAQLGGIMSGMYTGGMVNAAALQAIFRVDSENYILLSSYDIIISFLYLVFLISVGIPMFRRLYGEHKKEISQSDQEEINRQIEKTKENPYRKLLSREGMRQLGKTLLLTIGIVAVSGGVALLLPEGWFMVVFILLITTLGVVASFFPAVRKLDTSYDAGMYLIYIFSITIASMADFSNLQMEGGVNLLIFLTIAIFGSLLIHALFCRLMRIDADSMMVSSVSFINSPPFVPMTSAAMRNKNALVTGLAAGIVGYALGNHFGVLMAQLLSLL
ncbi:MAG: DUF819 family protein [Rikenellaceae bacterium]|nr:DUF819 family protein [Rikenellaceae bacterium]